MAGSQYQIPGNRSANRGDCNFDYRRVANVSLVLQSTGLGDGWTRRLTKDWQLAPIVQYRSGAPLTVTSGSDVSLTGVGQDRPNVIDPSAIIPANQSAASWFYKGAFANGVPGTYGNSGRDAFRGPHYVNLDFSLSRNFSIHEGWQLEVRGESFNALNHPNLKTPNVTLSSSSFGVITTAEDPRILQFGMKLKF